MKQSQPSPAAVWEKILEQVRMHAEPSSFTTWFEPVRASHQQNTTLYVHVPNKTFQAWHASHAELLRDALERLPELKLHGVEFLVPEKTAAMPGVLLADVQTAKVKWLWQYRIPLGKLTILDGDPDVGKSLLTLDLAARLSAGKPFPGETQSPRADGAVILSAEDGLSDTIRPRLEAAGADLGRVVALRYSPEEPGEQAVSDITAELLTVAGAIRKVRARLVVLDVLMAYVSAEYNTWRDQDVRRALIPLAQLAEREKVAVICIRHFTKGQTANPLHRGGGSIGIIGGARAAMLVARDPKDPTLRILAQTKSNLGPPMPSLAFRIRANSEGVPYIVWKGGSLETAASLVAASADNVTERTILAEAKQLLWRDLQGGQRRYTDLKEAWKAAGLSDKTIKRAKVALGIRSFKIGRKGHWHWFWKLPPKPAV